ncbi:hypothetical protein B7P43_G03265 [Cryptotermes secundus]|uniref:PiggyBac transposable element-derived protein domain-containing protein n=1 Tax=Cryptotermes secundus TaxID=105785 RepID=A0A2J7PIE8_9NEOP|nr:hypothetical protein B7P43_G03265 [Cryptotermes secundus]
MGKVDKTPALGQFTGNQGVKQISSDPTQVSEVAELFFGDSFFDMLCQETNRYYLQHREYYDRSYKALKWVDVTSAEMRKYFAIIFLMGHTRRDNLKEYWSSDPFLEIPIFGKLMSRKRFEQILWCLHFNDNELQPQSTSRLFKIQPLLNFFVQKFQIVYKPNQQLSLDESVIPWRGRLRMRTYNPGKLTKYGLLVRVVTESTSGYIGNLEIYSGEGKKLQETILSVLEPYLDQNYHVYQDNYYNSVTTAEHLFLRKVHVCGTIRVNRGLPPDLKEECKSLKHGETTFRRKGDILLQSWRDTRVVNMISTIHNSSMVDVQRRHGQVKKPVCITEYNVFMKGVDKSRSVLGLLFSSSENSKVDKESCLVAYKLCHFQFIFGFQKSKPSFKIEIQGITAECGKSLGYRPHSGSRTGGRHSLSTTGAVYSHPMQASF